MNKLCGTRTYLAGAMDRVKDGGVGWRNEITPFLEDMGVVVLDPCKKELFMSHGMESDGDRARREELKQFGHYDQLATEVKEFRSSDLNAVDIVDFLVVNIDCDIHACGTYEESFWANRCKKPVLIHCEQGKKNAPDWLFGTFPHEHIFDNWLDLKEYLVNIDYSTMDIHKRWTFFNLGKKTLSSLLKAAEHDSELRGMIDEFHRKNN